MVTTILIDYYANVDGLGMEAEVYEMTGANKKYSVILTDEGVTFKVVRSDSLERIIEAATEWTA